MDTITIRKLEAWVGTCLKAKRSYGGDRAEATHVCRELFETPTDSDQQRFRLVEMSQEEHERVKRRINDHKHYRPTIRGACYNGTGRRDHYVPFVYLPDGTILSLPSIPYIAAAMLFCDYVAEHLHKLWKRGMFRYAWADPASDHPFFNLSKATRLRNQDSDIYKLAEVVAVHLEDCVAPTNWVPEHKELRVALMALIEGKLEIKYSAAGRPKGSKNKVVGIDRLNKAVADHEKNVLQLSKEVGAAQQDIVGLVKKVEGLQDQLIQQTLNVQKLMEKLNECIQTVNGLVRVHKSWVDENGTLHAEHRESQALPKLKELPKEEDRKSTEPAEEQEVTNEPTRERASVPAKKGPLFV